MRFILRKLINLILVCILLSAFPCRLYAQQYDKAIVKISQNPIDITTLAKTIAKQTGLQYSLNMQNALLKKRIALKTGNWQLSDILKQVQQQAGLNHRIIGDHILFMDYQPPINNKSVATNTAGQSSLRTNVAATPSKVNNNVAPVIKPKASPVSRQQRTTVPSAVIAKNKAGATTSGKVIESSQTARKKTMSTAGSSISVSAGRKPTRYTPHPSSQGRDTTDTIATDNKGVSSLLSPIYAVTSNYATPKVLSLATFGSTDSTGNKTTPGLRMPVPALMKTISIAKENPKEDRNRQKDEQSGANKTSTDAVRWYRPFVKAGFSADEILYLNASLMAGIKYIYGIISYGTTFTGGRLRYGAGIPVKLNDEQQLHFTFTTGTLNRRTSPDSVIVYGVKEQLTRYGAGWSKTVNSHVTIQAQLHYNILKKTSDSTSMFLQNQAGDYRRFEYGKVPYVLSQSYGNAGDFKRWIGIQISIFYKLF